MTPEETKEFVYTQIVWELGLNREQISDHKTMRELGADSIECIGLAVRIEKGLNIDLGSTDVRMGSTVKDVVDATYSKVIGF